MGQRLGLRHREAQRRLEANGYRSVELETVRDQTEENSLNKLDLTELERTVFEDITENN